MMATKYMVGKACIAEVGTVRCVGGVWVGGEVTAQTV